MMHCPQCHRTYAEDFSFCLEDGARLVDPRSVEKTAILPTAAQAAPTEVTPVPTTVPGPAAPTVGDWRATTTPTSRSHSSLGRTIVVVLGLIAVVLVWGVIKVGLWWLDRNQRSTTQQVNSAPATVTASPIPGGSPAPSIDLQSLVGPQPSVSPADSSEQKPGSAIAPGTYQCEINHGLGEFSKQEAAFKLRITFNADGTYFEQGFISMPSAGLKDQLAMEEKGNYSASRDTLILNNRLRRELILGDSGWNVPTDGAESQEKLRISAKSFQVYDNDEKQWFTFSRL